MQTRTVSARFECATDLLQFLQALDRFEPGVFQTAKLPTGDTVQFESTTGLAEMVDMAFRIPNCHVLAETLRPVKAAANSFRRESIERRYQEIEAQRRGVR